MDTPTTSTFHLDLPDGGRGTILVDGHNLTDSVAGVELVAGFGAPSRLVLHAAATPGTIEGIAIIEQVAVTADHGAAVRSLDAGEVRRRALADLYADMDTDPYQQMLDIVAALLDEQVAP